MSISAKSTAISFIWVLPAAKHNSTHMEVVLLPLELSAGVDAGGAHLLYGHLHVVHPLDHLGVAGVIHLLDEGVVLLPERHREAGSVPLSPLGSTRGNCRGDEVADLLMGIIWHGYVFAKQSRVN